MSNSWVTRFNKLAHERCKHIELFWILVDYIIINNIFCSVFIFKTRLMLISQIRVWFWCILLTSIIHRSALILFILYPWPNYQTPREQIYTSHSYFHIDSHSCRRATLWGGGKVGVGVGRGRVPACFFIWLHLPAYHRAVYWNKNFNTIQFSEHHFSTF